MNDPKKYLSILGVLAIACFALALMLGATFKSPAAVLQGLMTHDFDIWQYRMPRAILAVLVGAALALSGTIIQGIIHNPLVSPDILSINHGASLCCWPASWWSASTGRVPAMRRWRISSFARGAGCPTRSRR